MGPWCGRDCLSRRQRAQLSGLLLRVSNEDQIRPTPSLMGHILLRPKLSLDPAVYLSDSEQGLMALLSQSLLLETQLKNITSGVRRSEPLIYKGRAGLKPTVASLS